MRGSWKGCSYFDTQVQFLVLFFKDLLFAFSIIHAVFWVFPVTSLSFSASTLHHLSLLLATLFCAVPTNLLPHLFYCLFSSLHWTSTLVLTATHHSIFLSVVAFYYSHCYFILIKAAPLISYSASWIIRLLNLPTSQYGTVARSGDTATLSKLI